ncbi:MAG: S1C family serine protease, partial [Actinobacteria bacterium]|nr:S1C family serine protease [Actinomycetota bacterium]
LRDPAGPVGVAFAGGRPGQTGSVAGVDDDLDLALIRVATGEIEPLVFAPEAAGLGAAVIALANPGGQGVRATLGFVAATGCGYRGPRGRVVSGALEHTATLPRGSAGGPLLDGQGRVVGLNAVRVQGGLILTLPGIAVSERVELLRRGARPRPPVELGVAVVSPGVARRLRRAVGLSEREGLLIHAVAGDSPAERAGLRAGDLIVGAGEAPIDGVDALHAALDLVGADATMDLKVVRGVEEHTVGVQLGNRQ